MSEKVVELLILDDSLPEPFETVLVYLTAATGGARVASGTPDSGKKVFIKDFSSNIFHLMKDTKFCVIYS